MRTSVSKWFGSGTPWVWMNAAAVAISLIMVVGLIVLIAWRGLGHFWPHDVIEARYQIPGRDVTTIAGEIVDNDTAPAQRLRDIGVPVAKDIPHVEQLLIKKGNRDISGSDFGWVVEPYLTNIKTPNKLMVLERREWGNFYGYLKGVKEGHKVIAEGDEAWPIFQQKIDRAHAIYKTIKGIEKHDIGIINAGMERLRLEQRSLELKGEDTPSELAKLEARRAEYQQQYEKLSGQLDALNKQLKRDSFVAITAAGVERDYPISDVVRAYLPNAMGVMDKARFYMAKIWEFVSDDPREANTEGGVFPAIFGTVMMVLLMSLMVTPLGVITAIYLREYAHQGVMTRLIRIAVNNLAGVPSIVYGVFGLGFFVYILGGSIDQLFFKAALPSPTFGTPGLLWASLTLALLTLPVVIVATEEGLSRIPRSIREGSLALGATKLETLWKVVLPMASPAIMTGVILAVARAAGEVAPLMLVGVVKLAPTLPVNDIYPYVHLDQKFMHLGFHIFDVGFQSPNVEAARPLVYATALLLVIVIAALNLSAIAIRNHLREKYRLLEV